MTITAEVFFQARVPAHCTLACAVAGVFIYWLRPLSGTLELTPQATNRDMTPCEGFWVCLQLQTVVVVAVGEDCPVACAAGGFGASLRCLSSCRSEVPVYIL